MNLSASTSRELIELNELFDGMKQEMGMFGPWGLTRRRDEDEALPFNRYSASPLLPPRYAHSSPKDEEVMLNFFDENQAGSMDEASALTVPMMPLT